MPRFAFAALILALGVSLSPLALADEVTVSASGQAMPAPIAAPKGMDINVLINQTNFIVAHQCSGTLISLKYKLVLTNDHCLEGYVDKIEKDETGPTGKVEKVTREVYKDMDLVQKAYQGFDEVGSTTYQAKILFHVRKYDLAILQIKADTITQTVFSQVLPPGKDVKRGDPVYVVGNPYMLDANLNEGHVSSINRKLTWDDGEEIPYFGVDAGVNPGNSGGALYNSDLDLIGVPGAAMRNASGLGFAIPYTLIRKLLDENCYSDVWDAGAKQDHKTCEQAKLDKENAARAKAGLPPLDKPEPDRLGGGIPAARAMRLIDPAPARATDPIDLFSPLQ